jgi:hypothetical protein
MDQYIGTIELDLPEYNYPYFTILQDGNGYKAINPTNNGYFTIIDGVETLEQLYDDLTNYVITCGKYDLIKDNGATNETIY